ncbi:MAG: 4'-phosphopantetheinyl transferase superfamily protein [Desulfobacterales bacterium]|nr:4'-phosphopantetheinyl transferase superfamily protein [Desulfobacterales bacterium]
MKVYPVILPVPEDIKSLTGRDRAAFLSKFARRALSISAQKCGVVFSDLEKDENGAPLPQGKNYWSVSHKPEYVAGVCTSEKIGIDIEKIRPVSDGLFIKTANDKERGLSDADPNVLFFRFWTAKESVLKAAGVGIRDLMKCQVMEIVSASRVALKYQNNIYYVSQYFFADHIASIVETGENIEWTLLK